MVMGILANIIWLILSVFSPSEVSADTQMEKFKQIVAQSKHILILSGAGLSAESDIPTFRGSGGFWRKYESQSLATPTAFKKSPSLVWEFYHYRRELVLTKNPNKAHYAIAEVEKQFAKDGRKVTVVTQNVDGLHSAAGSKNVVEFHGSLFKTRCLKCHHVETNRDSPICPALKGKGEPIVDETTYEEIPTSQLPHCKQPNCDGLLRPNVVWFGENINPDSYALAEEAMRECDVCLIVGTSSVVQPAASFGPRLVRKGVPVAEFNIEKTPCTDMFPYFFEGPCSKTVPEALSVE